jgi:hypothetical protein
MGASILLFPTTQICLCRLQTHLQCTSIFVQRTCSHSAADNLAAMLTRFRSSVGSVDNNSLRPASAAASRTSAVNNHIMSPSDIVGPSPVTSVGTEATEIEDEASEETQMESTQARTTTQSQVRPSSRL